MNLRIKGGRSCFYQWDSGQTVIVEHEGTIHEVHFAHKGDENALTVIAKEIENGVEANVPNILLQSSEDVYAYLVFRDEDGTETRKAVRIPVLSRPKPETYVYTETEVLNYAYLDERLKELEGEGLAKAVADYLKENPAQAGATKEEAAQIQQNKTDIEQLAQDKLDASALPEAVNDALAQAKASGEFKGEKGDPGEPGKTPEKGKDYFTDADKQEIAEQAAGMVEIPEGGSGLSKTAKTLLITILRNGVYNTDQSANITALATEVGVTEEEPDIPDVPDEPDEPVVTKYTITNELVNVKSSNSTSSVNEGASYTATLTADDGYEISNVTVYMGGADVTASVYANGVITISSVTGNVEIIASAVVVEEKPAELNTDGLDSFFDLRNVTGNSVSGGGGSIYATIGDGMIWNWVSPLFSSTDDTGSVLSRAGLYSADKTATQTSMGTAYTAIAAGYTETAGNAPCVNGFTYSNIEGLMAKPSYTKTDGTTIALSPTKLASTIDAGDYCTVAITVEGNILKYYLNGVLTLTFDGVDYDGFDRWDEKTGIHGSVSITKITCTSFAVYNRALSNVEMLEMNEYLKTLEVTA